MTTQNSPIKPLNAAIRIDYKVYIAGVLVPCSNVTVMTSVPGTSSAQISLPAHPLLIGLGKSDRLQVAIFYLDSNKDTPINNLQWCLLFEGYLSGQNYASSPLSREITFFALSNISVFNNLYLEFLGGKGRGRVGTADKITPDEITMKGNYPRRFFTKELKNKTYVKRPFDLVGNIFLATTGRFLDNDIASKTSTKNLDQQITRLVSITSVNRDRQYSTWSTTDSLTALDKYSTLIKETIKELYKSKELDVAIPLGFEDRLEGIQAKSDTDARVSDFEKLLAEVDRALIEDRLSTNVGKRNTFARTPVNTGFFARFFNLTKMEQHFVASPIIEGYPDGDTTKLPSGIFPFLKTRRGRKYVRAITRQTGRKFGPGGNVATFLSNLFGFMGYELTDLLAPPIYLADKNGLPKGRFKSGDKNNRIAQHVTKPVTLYGLPPACNTIFPCMVRSWNVSSDYSTVPTRLYYERASQGRRLDTKSSQKGYADGGTHVGYPAKITRHAQDASNLKRSDLEVLVFPEEYYKGPNCVFNPINPLLYEIKRQENAGRLSEVDKLSAEDKTLFGKDDIPADQLNYLEEALVGAKAKGNSSYGLYVKQAQVDYVTARTAGTNMQISSIFNPNIVAGFSSIMFDSMESNSHMVGYVRQITHTLTQQGSSTSIAYSNTRSLREMLTGILNQGGKYAMHPVEPLTEVREVFQVEESANLYYGNLLYRNSASFDSDLNTDIQTVIKDLDTAKQEKNKKEQELEGLEEHKILGDYGLPQDVDYTTGINDLKLEIEDLEDSISDLEEQKQRRSTEKHNFVLNWKALVDVVSTPGASNGAETITDLNSFVGSQADRKLSRADRQKAYKSILRGHIIPKRDFAHIFYSLPVALRFVSRPICTLEEYIDFYKSAPDFVSGASSVTGGRGRGIRAGARYLDDDSKQAKFYRIIREFVGGPGFEPGSKVAPDVAQAEASADQPQVALELTYRSSGPSNEIIEKVFAILKEGDTASIQDLPDISEDAQEVLLLYADIISSRGKL
jgi:hypothetical protein